MTFPCKFWGHTFSTLDKRIQWKSQFWKFCVLWGQNLPNFSCHFPNHKSVFLQILHHTLVSWNIGPLYFFRSNIIYFGQKQPIKVQVFETFEFSSQNLSNFLCQFWNNKLITFQICSSCIFYFGQKDPMKISILTLSSVLMKICQIRVMFETKNKFFFKFWTTLWYHQTQLFHTYFS